MSRFWTGDAWSCKIAVVNVQRIEVKLKVANTMANALLAAHGAIGEARRAYASRWGHQAFDDDDVATNALELVKERRDPGPWVTSQMRDVADDETREGEESRIEATAALTFKLHKILGEPVRTLRSRSSGSDEIDLLFEMIEELKDEPEARAKSVATGWIAVPLAALEAKRVIENRRPRHVKANEFEEEVSGMMFE